MSDRVCYIVTVEGIAAADSGIAKFCYPEAPDYATAQYNAGLAEPPTGSGSRWDLLDQAVTVGRFRVVFRPDVGPMVWMKTRPKPVNEISSAALLSAVATTLNLQQTATGTGIAVDDVIHVEREALLVSAIPGARQLTVTRGYAGTSAEIHAAGSDIYDTPPALTGRAVDVFEVSRSGSSAGAETRILRGFISGEPSSGLHWIALDCLERFADALFNEAQTALVGLGSVASGNPSNPDYAVVELAPRGTGDPIGHADGCYFYAVGQGAVYPAAWSGSQYRFESWDPVWRGAPRGELAHGQWYSVLLSNADLDYPFGHDGTSASDNPAVLALNLITSIDGTNGDYDRGTLLYPDFSLGVDESFVDVASFADAASGPLAGVHARWFWLGGLGQEKVLDALARLMSPFGFSVCTRRDGKYALLRLSDVYPEDSTVTLNEQHTIRPELVEMQTQGRALDRVRLEVNPGPDGSSNHTVIVEEITGRAFYPRHVGAQEVLENCPYDFDDLSDLGIGGASSQIYRVIASRIRRLADRVALITVDVGTEKFDVIDVGSAVELHGVGLRSATTGLRLTSADDSLAGIVTECRVDWARRVSRITVALTDTGKVAVIAPSAEVISVTDDGSRATITVEQREFTATGDTDPQRFAAGDKTLLLGSRMREVSAFVGTVYSVTSSTIVFDAVDPWSTTIKTGDLIVYADYDDVAAQQITNHAWAADGDASEDPDLGSADVAPYVFGD